MANSSECERCTGPLDTQGITICDNCLMAGTHGSQDLFSQDQHTPSSSASGSQGDVYVPNTSNIPKICLPECAVISDARLAIIRCLWCRAQYHKNCVGVVYICDKCRHVPAQITEMSGMIRGLVTSMQSLVTDNKTLRDAVRNQSQTITDLQSCMHDLRTTPRHDSTDPSLPDLVIGSSVLRNIDESKLVNTKVKSISGGRISDVREALLLDNTRYNKATICVGGNDCCARTDQKPVEDIVASYRELISLAQSKAAEVSIGSILPRGGNVEAGMADRIDAVNAVLPDICKTDGATHVNNDEVFRLRDASMNDGYFIGDLTHPNTAGTNKLATSLKLNVLPEHRGDVTTSYSAAVKRPNADHGNSRSKDRTQGRKRQARSQRKSAPRDPSGNRGHGNGRDDVSHDDRSRSHDRSNSHDDNPPSRDFGSRDQSPPSDSTWQRVPYRSQQRDARRPGDSGVQRSEDSCYYCNERNHRRDSCRHGQPIQCDVCHEYGHKSKHHNHGKH